MAKLIFDKAGERYYETGVEKCALFLQANDGTYPSGVAWNGITEIQENPSGGESNKQYADDIDYLNLISKETFGGSIATFTTPKEWEECDGSKEIAPGVYIHQQNRRTFGLAYKTLLGNDIEGTDYGYKLHLVWGAKASPSERSRTTTNESPEATNPSFTFDTTPLDVPGYKPTSHIELRSDQVNPEKLAAFEEIIYGSETTDAKLPLPAEVYEFFKESPTPPTPTPSLTDLTITPEDPSKNVLGKLTSELQTGVTIVDGEATGTINYVTDYTGFDGSNPELQEGHYIVIKIADIDSKAVSVTGAIVPGISGPAEMINDPDLDIVLRITDKDTQKATFVQTDADGNTNVQEIGLSGLTLAPIG